MHKVGLMKLDQSFSEVFVSTHRQSSFIKGLIFLVESVHDNHLPSGTDVFETSQLRSDTHLGTFLVNHLGVPTYEFDANPLSIVVLTDEKQLIFVHLAEVLGFTVLSVSREQ